VQSAYTSMIEQMLLKWNGRDCDGSMHYTIGFYCCHVTVCSEIWLVLLSGSGSNSLKSWKFPGRFSYGLGTRLVTKWHEHPARGPRLESCLDPRSFGGFLSLSKAYIQSL